MKGEALPAFSPGSGRIDHDRILVRAVLGERRHRAVPREAALLAVFPDLLNGLLILINTVDHCTRVLHFGKRRLIHAAGITVVEGGDVNHMLIGLLVNAEGRMLRPRVVEIPFAGRAMASDRLTVLHRREEFFLPAVAPAFRRGEDPLDLLIAADLNNG